MQRAFVIMPFDPVFDGVWARIRAVLGDFGFDADRADTVWSQQNVLRDVLHGIDSADLVIADLTELNPNVMYELGLAHALDKPVLSITRDIQSLPFDLQSYRVMEYSNIVGQFDDFITSLQERLSAVHDLTFGSPVSDHLTGHAAPVVPSPSLASLVTVGSVAPLATSNDPIGFVDGMAIIEEDIVDLNAAVTDLGKAGETFNIRVTTATARMGAMKGAGARELRVVTREIAAAVSEYADSIRTCRENMETHWGRIDPALAAVVDYRISHADPEEVAKVIEELTPFVNIGVATAGAQDSFTALRTSLATVQGLDRDIDRQMKRVDMELEGLSSLLTAIVATSARVAESLSRLQRGLSSN